MSPSKLCRYIGCNNVIPVSSNHRYCPDHIHIEEQESKNRWVKSAPKLKKWDLYDNKWKVARDDYLRLYPYCVQCGQVGKVVDHIIPHRGDLKLFWDRSNWQTLCIECNLMKTNKDMLRAKQTKKQMEI